MSNSNSSKQILLSVIGIAILVVAVVGVSFAFFNYTRTGEANTIRTGTISFSTTNIAINTSNLFPIDKSNVDTDSTSVGLGSVTISGHTSYANGIDFIVTASDVSNNIGTEDGKLPVSIRVTADDNLSGVKAFGSNDGVMTLNSFEDGTTITSGSILASGRIPANTSINGVITIKAYLDADGIAITDTYDATSTETIIDPNTNEEIIRHKPTDQNGTTSTWVNGRTVLTTDEWNQLSSTAVSFKIRVEANEGA